MYSLPRNVLTRRFRKNHLSKSCNISSSFSQEFKVYLRIMWKNDFFFESHSIFKLQNNKTSTCIWQFGADRILQKDTCVLSAAFCFLLYSNKPLKHPSKNAPQTKLLPDQTINCHFLLLRTSAAKAEGLWLWTSFATLPTQILDHWMSLIMIMVLAWHFYNFWTKVFVNCCINTKKEKNWSWLTHW